VAIEFSVIRPENPILQAGIPILWTLRQKKEASYKVTSPFAVSVNIVNWEGNYIDTDTLIIVVRTFYISISLNIYKKYILFNPRQPDRLLFFQSAGNGPNHQISTKTAEKCLIFMSFSPYGNKDEGLIGLPFFKTSK
jgi:CRISPR/Cas system endoribonuclease Cas6 (RAMP superfamily)